MTLSTLTNANGTSILVSTFGARLVELLFRDRNGNIEDITLGYDFEDAYRTNPGGYFGATVGRVAGRIADAHFVGGGLDFRTAPNEGTTHLHGGPERALDRVEWEQISVSSSDTVVYRYVSPACEEGYPGNLTVTSSYRLTDTDDLIFEIQATTDAPTPVNLVNHAYVNLSGNVRRSIVEHELMIRADVMLDLDDKLLPRGGVTTFDGGAYDFRIERTIAEGLPEASSEPWPGIDSTYILRTGTTSEPVATLRDSVSGRLLSIRTTEPTLQVYTGNQIQPGRGRSGAEHGPGLGICLEAHRVPDSPRLPEWPSIVVEPGNEYLQRTVWSLSTF